MDELEIILEYEDDTEQVLTALEEEIVEVFPELEDLEVTPSAIEQKFKSEKYGYDNITVKAVETEELNATSSLENQEYDGLFGKVKIAGLEAEETTVIPTTETQVKEGIFNKVTVEGIQGENLEIMPSAENQNFKGIYTNVNVIGEENLKPENIKKGESIFGVEGNASVANAKITNAMYLFYKNIRTDYLQEILSLCEKITSAYYMFYLCDTLTELDVSILDTSEVTDMQYAFYRCSKLLKLNVSGLNTSKVTNMYSLFYGCEKITELDVSSFNTSNVTNMNSMFYENRGLKELDVSGFNTSKVVNMGSMFYRCDGLKELDVSNFNTSNVTNMNSMFNNLRLSELDISNFDMGKVTNTSDMFRYNSQLMILHFGTNYGKGFTQKSNNYSNYKLDLSSCTKLTHDSLMSVINNLYDLNLTYDVANGGTLYTQSLTLGSTNKAKLTAEEIAIATNKGWTVS